MMTAGERADTGGIWTSLCVHALNCLDKDQLTDVSSLILVDPSAIWHANLASKGAIFERGGVLKSTLVVDNDTTVHGVHTNTVASSPSVLIKCSLYSSHSLMRTLRMNDSRKRFTTYDTQSYYFIFNNDLIRFAFTL